MSNNQKNAAGLYTVFVTAERYRGADGIVSFIIGEVTANRSGHKKGAPGDGHPFPRTIIR